MARAGVRVFRIEFPSVAEADADSPSSPRCSRSPSCILDKEEEEDKKFVAEQTSLSNPEGKLASLKTTEDLTMCRSKLSDRKSQFVKAKDVTKKLCKRMDEELDSLMLITKSIAEIEAEMPHLDGTTLEQEPCVGELRSLIQQLEQL